MTPTEALDRIAALCNDADHESGGDFRGWLPVDDVRAVLAEVTPEPSNYDDLTYEELRQAREDDLVEHGQIMQQQRDEIRRLREPGRTLDRDQAREAILDAHPADTTFSERWMEDLLDHLAGCVRPATIDRDALDRILNRAWHDELTLAETRDAILALVRPVAGVTLTPDEAEWAAFALRKVAPDFGAPFQRDVAEKLAARLKATR